MNRVDTQQNASPEDVASIAETYYDSEDADRFYERIWGGEDIHIGLYETTPDIKEASRLTVERMAETLGTLAPEHTVLDLGAGYGGAARYLSKSRGCKTICLNISEIQNDRNRMLNKAQGLDGLVAVHHGTFEAVPEPDTSVDVVWSQDAILHSGDRDKVFREVNRVLKPGGRFIFTDPMQADDCPEGVLQPVYDRIHLNSLGSFGFYREAAKRVGFEPVSMEDLTPNLRRHYNRVREVLTESYDDMVAISSKAYLDRMLTGLKNWVEAADRGYLAWGILFFRKPA